MAIHCSSVPSLSLKKLTIPPKSISSLFKTMYPLSNSGLRPSASSAATIHQVPGLDPDEVDRIADQTFQRYSSSSPRTGRGGLGTAVVWFRNDLRVLDNEALYKAWVSSEMVLPVYCVDPRLFGTTYYFGFPKTGGTVLCMTSFFCCDERFHYALHFALYTPLNKQFTLDMCQCLTLIWP
jgi:deoxyribodipyrimidine photo-lyase